MKVELRLGGLIQAGGREIALGKTHALLEAVDRTASLDRAAAELGIDLDDARTQLAVLEAALGRPLADDSGGALTPFGEALRRALAETVASFEAEVRERGRALEERLARLMADGA